MPLIVGKNQTKELAPHKKKPYHTFSYIKLEENATLTVAPYHPTTKQGGALKIHCLGDCILGRNAKIDLSGKGYAGGSQNHPQGLGLGGGQGGQYCAAGGSHATPGSAGKCQDHHYGQTYHALYQTAHVPAIFPDKNLLLGSGGGYIQYDKEGAQGAHGGGALYLTIDNHLQLDAHASILADGGHAEKLTGGAGSGGTICIHVKGNLKLSASATPHFSAQGGHNKYASYPTTQGYGGMGTINLFITKECPNILTTLHVPQPTLIVPEHAPVIITCWSRQYQKKLQLDTQNIILLFLSLRQTSYTTLIDITNHWLRKYTAGSPFFKEIALLIQDFTLEKHQATPSTPVPTHLPVLANYCAQKGHTYQEQGRYHLATSYYTKNIYTCHKIASGHPHTAHAYYYQGIAYEKYGYHGFALHHLQQALTRYRYLHKDTPHPDIVSTLSHLGYLYTQRGNAEEAEKHLNEAEKSLKLIYHHHDHRSFIPLYIHQGFTFSQLNRRKKAHEILKKALKLCSKWYQDTPHPDSALALDLLGILHQDQGKYDKADEQYQKSLKIRQQSHGDAPHPDIAQSNFYIGTAYKNQKNYLKAIQYFETAIQIWLQVSKEHPHPNIIKCYYSLSEVYAYLEKYEEANQCIEEANKIRKPVQKERDNEIRFPSKHQKQVSLSFDMEDRKESEDEKQEEKEATPEEEYNVLLLHQQRSTAL